MASLVGVAVGVAVGGLELVMLTMIRVVVGVVRTIVGDSVQVSVVVVERWSPCAIAFISWLVGVNASVLERWSSCASTAQRFSSPALHSSTALQQHSALQYSSPALQRTIATTATATTSTNDLNYNRLYLQVKPPPLA